MLGPNWYLSAAVAAAAFVAGIAFILGADAVHDRWSSAPETGWREISWPFPRDAWPAGRAFRCTSGVCEDGAELYVRPKIGFCNCATGVSDDDEVDRVTDLDLISERFIPAEAGKPIHIADLAGRARRYNLQMPDGSMRAAMGLAVSRGCDVVVVAIQGRAVARPEMQSAAVGMLSSKTMTVWLNDSLGGG